MNQQFPNGLFIGRYKGINYYVAGAKIQCLFGWLPKEFDSIHAFKYAVTRWEKT